MQSLKLLARRIHPRVVRRAYRPGLQRGPNEAKDAQQDFQEYYYESEPLSSQAEIAQLFHEIDTNGDGEISPEELAQALRKGKLPTSQEHLDKLFREIDTDQSGGIDITEFTAFVQERRQKLHQAYQWILQHRTSLAETAHHGFTAQTFRTAAKKAAVHLSDADVQLIMQQLDQNGDQRISYREFVDCLLLAPEINPRYFLDSWYTNAFCDDAESQYSVPREIRVDEDESFVQMVTKKLACGGLAGALSRTLTAPIDRIRVLMMTSAANNPLGLRAALTTASNGGYMRLWLGNGVNCLKIAPEMGIKLLAFDVVKNSIAQDPSNVSMTERFAAGGLAGVMAQLSVYPMEVIKTRLAMTVNGETSVGMMECARRTLSNGGYRAFYAGAGPSTVGIIPYAAIDLSLNSLLKEYAANQLQQAKQETSVPVLLGCGMVSSGTATVLTFPLNVIRTQAQATGYGFGRVVGNLQSQGWRAFYRGLVPCLAKVLPATSISYAAYEYLGGTWDKAVATNKV